MISIIVPVYKVENYLRACVESIISQSYQNWELLLIDDGSPDSSGAICDEYATTDSRIRVFHKHNGGVSSARNLGLKEARGEWVTFVDSDDSLLSNALETYINTSQNDPQIDVIKAGYIILNEKKNSQTTFSCESDIVLDRKADIVRTLNGTSQYHGFLWNECIRRELIGATEFDTSIQWNEDNIFSYDCFCRARKIAIVSTPVYCYYIRGTSTLSNIKDPFVVISTCAKIYEYRMRMLAGIGDMEMIHKFESGYVEMFHFAIKLLNTFDYKNRVNDFKNNILYRDVLKKDLTARLFIQCQNPVMSLILWKMANKIRVVSKKCLKL